MSRSLTDGGRRMKARVRLLSLGLAAFCVLVNQPVLAKTGPEESRAYYETAAKYAQGGDLRAAVIELKNALQSDPGNAEARLLLGEVYVKLGNGGAAAKELGVAERLGVAKERLVALQGRALLLQGKYEDVLDGFPEATYGAPLDLEVLLLRADAHARLGQWELARQDYDNAAQKAPRDARVPLGLGRVELAQRDFAAAEAQATAALERQPELTEARLLQADARRLNGKPEESVAAFQAVLAEPGLSAGGRIRAGVGLASALLTLNRDSEAQQEIDAVHAIAPDIPLAAYLQALIKVRQNDYAAARKALDAAAPGLDGFAPAQFLFGAVYYQAGELETARSWFGRYLRANPDNLQAQKLMAATLLRLQATDEAVALLERAKSQTPDDPQILLLLGNAYLSSGRATEAASLLQRAAELAPQDPRVLGQLAISQLATGDRDEARATLNATFDLGADASAVGYALAFAHLRAGAFEDALTVAQDLRQRFPQSAIAANLEGAAYGSLGKLEEARSSFEAVLAIDPNFQEARANLAALKAQAGDDAGAEAEYQTILSAQKDNPAAMMGMAALADRRGDRPATQRWLEEAIEADPNNLKASLALADYYAKGGDTAAAIKVMEGLAVRQPTNPQVLLALGQVQRRAGDVTAAMRTYERLSEVTNGSPGARQLLAEAQLAAGDLKAALTSYEGLKEAAAEDAAVWNNLAWLYQQLGDERAAAHGERALELAPGQPAIMDTLGWILLDDKDQLARATGLLKQAHEAAPGAPDITFHYAAALHRSGDDKAARALLQPLLDAGQPFSSRAEAAALLEQLGS
ncbi:MAG: XrtA/PEP-CTERM system TPR-repeat protein PrsT [Kiloniellaceae bacterium]